jgi:hypothetical protein
MGYCVDWEVNISVPANKMQKCLEAINELMKPANVEAKGSGGSYSNGGCTEKWYAWVTNPPNNRYETLKEAFEGWGFPCEFMKEIALVCDCCESEKLGQQELFLEAIAPFVEADSYVIGHGEDGALVILEG